MKRLREQIQNALRRHIDPPGVPTPAAPPALLREVRHVTQADGLTIVVTLAGEIDLHKSPEMRTELLDLVVRYHPVKLILNLADVPYMDSSAVAVMVEILQHLRKERGKICLINVQPRVRGLIEIARLNTIFAICADEAEAMEK